MAGQCYNGEMEKVMCVCVCVLTQFIMSTHTQDERQLCLCLTQTTDSCVLRTNLSSPLL